MLPYARIGVGGQQWAWHEYLFTSGSKLLRDRVRCRIGASSFPRRTGLCRRAPWPLEGQAEYVARPKSTEDVSALVKLCHTHRVAIIPYGGGTGLVGGQLAETGAVP